MVNTILAKRVNHIVAKGDHPVWPKGAKSHGFSKSYVDDAGKERYRMKYIAQQSGVILPTLGITVEF